MKNRKLNYRFHNPNSAEVTADHILKVFLQVNEKKVEKAVQDAMRKDVEEQQEVVRQA